MPKAARTTPIEFKGLADWIEVFRAGSHVDSKGRACAFTTADLDQMVANEALGKPPAVLGHPKHDDPAYAWATLKRDGDSLFAKFSDIHPQFEAGVKSKAYINRSVSLVKDQARGWRVRHIGWLGAAPPAIDGLKPVEFSADDAEDVHEFGADDLSAAYAIGDVATLLRGLREYVIGRDGIETADRVLPTWQIDSVANAATRIREQAVAEPTPAFNAPTGDPDMPGFTQEDLDRARQEGEAAARATQAAEFTANQAELERLKAERRAERISARVTAAIAGGLAPAMAQGMAEFVAAVETGEVAEFQFTAADKTEQKKAPADWFWDFVAAVPKVKLGQRMDDESGVQSGLNTKDSDAIQAEALKFQAAQQALGITVPIDQAVTEVMRRAGAPLVV